MLMWNITRDGRDYGTYRGAHETEAFVRMVARVFRPVVVAHDGRLRWREPAYESAIGDVSLYAVALVEDEQGIEVLGEAGNCMVCHEMMSRYDCNVCKLKLCMVCVVEHATRCG